MTYISRHEQALKEAKNVFVQFISEFPWVAIIEYPKECHHLQGHSFDLEAVIKVAEQEFKISIEVKAYDFISPIERTVEMLIRKSREDRDRYYMLMLPFVGDRIRALHNWNEIGYLDFSKNCKINLGNRLIVDRAGKKRLIRFWETKRIGSYSGNKTRLVLDAIWNKVEEKWMIKDIVKDSGVSWGLACKVIEKLKDEGVIVRDEEGLLGVVNKEVFKEKFSLKK